MAKDAMIRSRSFNSRVDDGSAIPHVYRNSNSSLSRSSRNPSVVDTFCSYKGKRAYYKYIIYIYMYIRITIKGTAVIADMVAFVACYIVSPVLTELRQREELFVIR